jgi:Putative zinc-binding metallo-peptidase
VVQRALQTDSTPTADNPSETTSGVHAVLPVVDNTSLQHRTASQDRPIDRAKPAPPPADWWTLPDEKLLDLRMCDLGLTIEGSKLAERIDLLHQELAQRQIAFRPHYWLSDEWFTPDGVGGIAIPFYLAHPRLERLEESLMLEVEGGDPEWCMKILRHEAGHAIDNAFRLQRRRKRLRLFGPSSTPYPEYYTPKPYSKSFVLHLDSWYAQSHPDEDFAETFAVWLNPDSQWRERYDDWPAIKKLEYVGDLMRELAGKQPERVSRRRVDPLSSLKKTLRQHYERKRDHYGYEKPNFYDRDLRRVFSLPGDGVRGMTAARFISRIRKDVCRNVARWTGEYRYTIDQVLQDMIARSRELGLRVTRPEDQVKLEFTILLTVQTMNYLHSGRHRVAL